MKGVKEYLKNDIKRLLVLIISLVTISISVILINGRTYELNFDINNENCCVTIEDENDSIEVKVYYLKVLVERLKHFFG
jgi:hypothetical protein